MFGEKMWMRTSSGRAGKRPCWQNWTGKQCGEGVPGEDSGMILKGYLAPGAKGQWWVLHMVETESLCWQRICIPFTSRVTLAMTPRLSERLFLHLLSQASHVRRVELSEGEIVLPWQTMWYLHAGGSQGRKADSFWWWLNLACPLAHEDTSQWRCLLCRGCCWAGSAESPGSCLAPSPVLFPPLLMPPHSLRGWGSGAEWKYNEHLVLSLAPGTELLKPSC